LFSISVPSDSSGADHAAEPSLAISQGVQGVSGAQGAMDPSESDWEVLPPVRLADGMDAMEWGMSWIPVFEFPSFVELDFILIYSCSSISPSLCATCLF
jgi:hypothetical protein